MVTKCGGKSHTLMLEAIISKLKEILIEERESNPYIEFDNSLHSDVQTLNETTIYHTYKILTRWRHTWASI